MRRQSEPNRSSVELPDPSISQLTAQAVKLRELAARIVREPAPLTLRDAAAGLLRQTANYVDQGADLARMAGRIEAVAVMLDEYVCWTILRDLDALAHVLDLGGAL